jgi:DNA-binding NarL/FixJ family response regulator
VKQNDIIIIADDNPGHAALIEKNLRRFGIKNEIYKFEEAETLLNFLSGNKSGSFMLLLDVRMPGMDGIELLKQIKQDDDLKRIPVCMVSTSDEIESVKLCVEYGCSAYVKKPIDYFQFSESMQQLAVFLLQVEVPVDKDGLEALEGKNRSLKDVLARAEREKNSIKENIAINIEKDLIPIIKEIKGSKQISDEYLSALEVNLKDLSSSFYKNLFNVSTSLTPAEVRICKMVKDGFQDKEIARYLVVSPATVQTHRKNIRRKLKITNKSVNLKLFLEELAM